MGKFRNTLPIRGSWWPIACILILAAGEPCFGAGPPVRPNPDRPTSVEFHRALVKLAFTTNEKSVGSRQLPILFAERMSEKADTVEIDVFQCVLSKRRFTGTIVRKSTAYNYNSTDGWTSVVIEQSTTVYGTVHRLRAGEGWKASIWAKTFKTEVSPR